MTSMTKQCQGKSPEVCIHHSTNPRLTLGHSWDTLTKELITLNKSTLKSFHKNLSRDVNESITVASCVDCVLMNIKSLDFMIMSINLLINRGVKPDSMLIRTLDQYYVLHFNKFMQYMVATKARADDLDMTKLPKNTQPNNSVFRNWCITIEEEL